jgi:hypothetical protein
MIEVVVLYVTISTGVWNAALRRLRLGFGTAALKGPRRAMMLTCKSTDSFSRGDQFCKGTQRTSRLGGE